MSTEELRELKLWTAEHVMGWKLANRFEGDTLISSHRKGGKIPQWLENWNPTTNDADAMAVWKACLAKVSCREIRQYQSTEEDGSKVFCIYLEGRREVIMAPTLPLAICLFAKKLHGG